MSNRFKLNEITPQRLASAVMRRVKDIPNWAAWNFGGSTTVENKRRLLTYKDKHARERCFIIANGPSLKGMDLSCLKNEITFGMNRIYLLFDQIPFVPTYYVCINELVLEEFSQDIDRLPMPKFLNWDRRGLFNQSDSNTMFLRYSLGIKDAFGYEPAKTQYSGGTVTYASLQLAYFMGFKEVVLIGLDHNYVEKGTPNKVEVRRETHDESHFHPNYFPKGVKWQLPDLLRSEVAYQMAREAFEKDGRRVIDATPGGKCQIFQKSEFTNLFNNHAGQTR
jgi:hypothetical protein